MNRLSLALISGGDSSERRVSMDSGNQVFEALDREKYRISRFDPKTDLARLTDEASGIDVALIILHGPFGEDGTIQGMLDLLDVPYQGSGVLGSALAMNKLASKRIYEKAGLAMPPYDFLHKGDAVVTSRIVDRLGLPLMVKPAAGGSSIGMTLVESEKELAPAIEKAFDEDRSVIIEAYLKGTEVTCAVVGNEHLETYPVVEIIPNGNHDFFDYDAKYTPGATREICPAHIPEEVANKVQLVAKKAHEALYCRGYSRTDMILQNREIYVIETNTIPGMTPLSLLPLSAAAAGISFSRLLDKLIFLGLEDYLNKSHIRDRHRRQRILKAMPSLT